MSNHGVTCADETSSWHAGWLCGCVTSAVTQGPVLTMTCAWGVMLCDFHIETLNNFSFEFVFCDDIRRDHGVCAGGLKSQLKCSPSSYYLPCLPWMSSQLPVSYALAPQAPHGFLFLTLLPGECCYPPCPAVPGQGRGLGWTHVLHGIGRQGTGAPPLWASSTTAQLEGTWQE